MLTDLLGALFGCNVLHRIHVQALVIPIFKSGMKILPNNYRPISLLPTLSKVLKKIFKYLGVILDDQLLFKPQTSN